MLIIDSQIHPYAPRRPGETAAAGQRVLGPDALIVEMDRVGVDRAVLVPPRVDLATSNEFALAAAVTWRGRFGVMGKLLLDRPESVATTNAWTGGSALLGYRVSFPPGKVSPADAEWLWSAAEERDFPVMVWAPRQLRELKEAALRHPGARIIVDHLGTHPDDRGGGVGEVIRDLIPLAELGNVAVKASSLPAHSTKPYPFVDLHPFVREVVERFGASRVFWGSDLTTLTCPYGEALRMFTEAMPFLAGQDLEEVMGLGIARWLRWQG